jgi:hypothetical protein
MMLVITDSATPVSVMINMILLQGTEASAVTSYQILAAATSNSTAVTAA